MLPAMTNTQPASVARALWYRTTDDNGRATGDSERARNRNDRGLFIYNTSYSAVSPGNGNGTFNVNQPAPLVLPETVCIDTTDGEIDSTCTRSTATTFLNLNLPANRQFPNASATTQPASSFTVCGLTGNSRRYQAVEKDLPTFDITGSTCPTNVGNPRSAIATFYTGLMSAALNPSDAAFRGTTPTLKNPTKPTGALYNRIRLTANNVAANANKINVYNLIFKEDIDNDTVKDTGEDINGNGVLDASALKNTELTLAASQNNPDPTFLLRADPNADVILEGLYVKLDGVDPNKVFWVFPRVGKKALTIRANDDTSVSPPRSQPTVLVGNFIGNMPATGLPTDATTVANTTGLNIGPTSGGKGVSIRSARFLGFRGFRAATPAEATAEDTPTGSAGIGVDSTAMITAMTTVNEPMVAPVLQIHSPLATATDNGTMPQPSTAEKNVKGLNGNVDPTATPTDGTGQWVQRASRSTVNVYFVAGNSPSRSYVPYNSIYTAESGGGLNNFVRFMENWSGRQLQISGGFIQNTRSVFATAPYSPNFPYNGLGTAGCFDASNNAPNYANRNNCIDTSSGIQSWFHNPAATSHALSAYFLFYQSPTAQSIPYFGPPQRLWGFDVGLLVQQPDLFAQRFSQPRPDSNEFFREANKDDRWVETLLCALQPAVANLDTDNVSTSAVNPGVKQRQGTVPTNYTAYALGIKDRPSGCPAPTYHQITN